MAALSPCPASSYAHEPCAYSPKHAKYMPKTYPIYIQFYFERGADTIQTKREVSLSNIKDPLNAPLWPNLRQKRDNMIELTNCTLQWDRHRGVLYVHDNTTGGTVLRICGLDKQQEGELVYGQNIDITKPEHVSYPE